MVKGEALATRRRSRSLYRLAFNIAERAAKRRRPQAKRHLSLIIYHETPQSHYNAEGSAKRRRPQANPSPATSETRARHHHHETPLPHHDVVPYETLLPPRPPPSSPPTPCPPLLVLPPCPRLARGAPAEGGVWPRGPVYACVCVCVCRVCVCMYLHIQMHIHTHTYTHTHIMHRYIHLLYIAGDTHG